MLTTRQRPGSGRYTGRGRTIALALAAASLAACSRSEPTRPLSAAAVGPLGTARTWHTATLLPTGKVLVAGGEAGTAKLATAELLDAYTGARASTGSLAVGRSQHTATLLASGKVLVVGGMGASGVLGSAELYDPATGTWTSAGALTTARRFHTATLLRSGKVLVAGGFAASAVSGAELYDPVAGSWTATGSLGAGRSRHAATLLPSGKVLVAGGADTAGNAVSNADVYDPDAGTWAATAPLGTGRLGHTATLLASGKVLVCGGSVAATGSSLDSAELFDPVLGTWSGTGPLGGARSEHAATLLASGKVLVAGGGTTATASTSLATTELYDPSSGTWSSGTALSGVRRLATATLLPSGRVLLLGGTGSGGTAVAAAELWDGATGSWAATGALATARPGATMTVLPSGNVLVAGGSDGSASVTSTELYDPGARTWSTGPAMTDARSGHSATLLPSGAVLVAGGTGAGGEALAVAELFDPATGAWSATGSMSVARSGHAAILLRSGAVLVVAGRLAPDQASSSAELYDPATGTWSATGSLAEPRFGHTATLLPSGEVLATGGRSGAPAPGVFVAGAERYDPGTGAWTTTGAPSTARTGHAATLLPSGRVLVAGGEDATGALASAELYDRTTEQWSSAAELSAARRLAGSALLPSGKVLLAGGLGATGAVSTAELYDPATGSWALTGSLVAARSDFILALLASGDVLAAGGAEGILGAELYDEGVEALAELTPVITASPLVVVAGDSFDLSGTLFTGKSEGSSGNTQSSSSAFPLVELRPSVDGPAIVAPATAFASGAVTASLPSGAPPGASWLTVTVNGARSAAVPIRVAGPLASVPASVTVPPRGTRRLSATGGSGEGLVWSMKSSPSGGSVGADGTYVAGATGNVTDVVQVVDSMDHSALTSVSVTAGVSITPGTSSTAPGGRIDFEAAGGSASGFSWSLDVKPSGGTIDGATGVYTAGATSGTDVVRVTDSLGNSATRAISVVAISIRPANVTVKGGATVAFSATGGTGSGYVWSLAAAPSGGSITASGAYTAGTTVDVNDVVQVQDASGSFATTEVLVRGPRDSGGCGNPGSAGSLLLLAALALRRRRA